MRYLPSALVIVALLIGVGCHGRAASTPSPPPTRAGIPQCRLEQRDSLWLSAAIRQWRAVGERVLEQEPLALPPLVLFDTRCVYHVTIDDPWRVTGALHRGTIVLPNGRGIPPIGIGITSPAHRDSSLFLAIALPEAWRADPRYRNSNESRSGWEAYLIGAFSHEMAHARMLPGVLSRLRELEAAIYPDTMQDNLVQDRFGRVPPFAESVARETGLLYRALTARTQAARADYLRFALDQMRQRRQRWYTGELSAWADVEQAFLDLEGVAQWTALHVIAGTTSLPRGDARDRLLARFRLSREFWSEDQGLLMILVLEEMLPDWQSEILSGRATAFALLERSLRRPQ